jgi:hypothetical protein
MAAMRLAAIALLALLAAGCSARTQIDASSNSGTSSVRVQIHAGDALAKAIVAGAVVAAAIDYQSEPRPFPRFSEVYDWRGATPAPPLAPGRRVHEQNCSQPLEDPSANLKCR